MARLSERRAFLVSSRQSWRQVTRTVSPASLDRVWSVYMFCQWKSQRGMSRRTRARGVPIQLQPNRSAEEMHGRPRPGSSSASRSGGRTADRARCTPADSCRRGAGAPRGRTRRSGRTLRARLGKRLGTTAEPPALTFRTGELHGRREEDGLDASQARARRGDGHDCARAVGRVAVPQVVVDLHHDPALGRERHPGPLGKPASASAGSPGGDPVRVVEGLLDTPAPAVAQPGASEARPAKTWCGGVEPRRLGYLSREIRKRITVDDLRCARHDARRGDGDIVRELWVEREAAVVVGRPLARVGR
jgi:hypothetical protein